MKKVTPEQENMLLDYIDGNLPSQQVEALEHQLRQDPELRARLEEFRDVNAMLKRETLREPGPGFTARVTAKIEQHPVRGGLSMMNGLLLLAGILCVLTITVTLLSKGVFDESTSLDLNNLNIAQQYIKQSLPAVSLNGKLIVNIIVILNLALAFVVLDRVILKPLFNKRMQAEA